ncbi:hypothetical protein VRK_35770 [Vibrio sp. MEBiC08052]|nr:hypothetical protein VRK_35770 [Vibrio sp. MEBiC08052]
MYKTFWIGERRHDPFGFRLQLTERCHLWHLRGMDYHH